MVSGTSYAIPFQRNFHSHSCYYLRWNCLYITCQEFIRGWNFIPKLNFGLALLSPFLFIFAFVLCLFHLAVCFLLNSNQFSVLTFFPPLLWPSFPKGVLCWLCFGQPRSATTPSRFVMMTINSCIWWDEMEIEWFHIFLVNTILIFRLEGLIVFHNRGIEYMKFILCKFYSLLC